MLAHAPKGQIPCIHGEGHVTFHKIGIAPGDIGDIASAVAVMGGSGGGSTTGGVGYAATRSELATKPTAAPVILTEAWRTGTFKFDSSNLSALVTADTAQGIYVAPSSNPTGAAGAWVRSDISYLRPEWFGVIPNDASAGAANNTAWTAMVSAINGLDWTYNGHNGAPEIKFTSEAYYFNSTLELKNSLHLKGNGAGMGGGTIATRLFFPVNTCGIRVNRSDTLGESGPIAGTTRADGSIIEGFYIEGSGTALDLKKSLIHLRARATVRDCWLAGSAGAGILVWADTTAPDWTYGNANNWKIDTVRCQFHMGGGVYIRGGDANAGKGEAIDASGNAAYGIADYSFLGNTWVGCHTDANGLDGDAGLTHTSMVSDGTWRYRLIHGQDASGAGTAPTAGASNAVWKLVSSGNIGSGIPLYSTYTGTYVSGGSYYFPGGNARTAPVGCYEESGQAPAILSAPVVSIGGTMNPLSGPHIFSNNDFPASAYGWRQFGEFVNGPTISQTFGGRYGTGFGFIGDLACDIFSSAHSVYSPGGWRLGYGQDGYLGTERPVVGI
jgi:hypothetical protein